jgi:Protein of unknown function (DUF664)
MSDLTSSDLLLDAFSRIREEVHAVVDGLDSEVLTGRLDPAANTIAWLVWHLSRIQDDHLADAWSREQVWLGDSWSQRFALPLDPADHGYGHTSEQVALVRAPAELLLGYHDAVHARTAFLVRDVTDNDLARVVDTRWTPPVTLGVRLVSVLGDCWQHVGQAAYVRGVLQRRYT